MVMTMNRRAQAGSWCPMACKAVKAHWNRVAALGCVVCSCQPAQIHHVHGRALTALGLGRGMGQKTSDFLVIPLCFHHHVGDHGIDAGMGVEDWEFYYGSQLEHLCTVSARLGFDVIEYAKLVGAH